MKNTLACPKCQSRQLWQIDRANQPDPRDGDGTLPLVLTTHALDIHKSAWMPKHRITAGTFEVWVCSACGYTEWYARDMNESLQGLSRHPEAGVRLIDTSGERGPFR